MFGKGKERQVLVPGVKYGMKIDEKKVPKLCGSEKG